MPLIIFEQEVNILIPLAKNIKRYFSLNEIAVVVIAIIISISAGIVVFYNLKKDVVINDNGKQIIAKTMKITVKEVLEQNGINVKPEDYINVDLNSKLLKIIKNKVDIKRAIPVMVLIDGNEIKLMTYRDTVREALENSPFDYVETDKLDGVNTDDSITKDMSIKVIRVKEETAAETEPIPFNVINKENNRMDKGTEKVAREGEEGTNEKLYKVVYEDGKQMVKDLLKETILANPIDKIIEYGTVLNYKTARGDVVRYKQVLEMRATAYTSSFADTGKNPGDPGFGITFTGVKATKGVIAVDPRVIPLGSRIYVEVYGNTPDYGYAVAADTGGAIKDDLIDVYFEDMSTANSWGVKRVKVYMLID